MSVISISIRRIFRLTLGLTIDFAFLMVVEDRESAQLECTRFINDNSDFRKSHLAPYLPAHPFKDALLHSSSKSIEPQAAAPFGSASILLISYAYIKMMGSPNLMSHFLMVGAEGLQKATKVALLNANYMRSRLAQHYKILYTNRNGMCAHEFILDAREFKESAGIEAIDIAKRLQDYGYIPTKLILILDSMHQQCRGRCLIH